MWKDFFVAGGFGMYPVSIFGFLLVAACVLYAIRPDRRAARLALTLGLLTFASGLLGMFTGMCNSALYIPQVAKPEQLEILALGFQESMHNVVLSLILVNVAGLVAAVGAWRSNGGASGAAAAT